MLPATNPLHFKIQEFASAYSTTAIQTIQNLLLELDRKNLIIQDRDNEIKFLREQLVEKTYTDMQLDDKIYQCNSLEEEVKIKDEKIDFLTKSLRQTLNEFNECQRMLLNLKQQLDAKNVTILELETKTSLLKKKVKVSKAQTEALKAANDELREDIKVICMKKLESSSEQFLKNVADEQVRLEAKRFESIRNSSKNYVLF